MADATNISSTRRVLSGAKFMYVTPWTDETTIGSTEYDITEIIADTVNIEQDDAEVNTTESEFSDSPLFESVKQGSYKFSATCVDTQNTIVKTIFGWSEDSNAAKKGAYAPTSYNYLYATIKVGFANAIVVMPKVRLDSKLVIGTLKTGQAQSQIGGTCYDGYVGYKNGASPTFSTAADYKKTPIAIVPIADDGATPAVNKTPQATATTNVKVVASLPT